MNTKLPQLAADRTHDLRDEAAPCSICGAGPESSKRSPIAWPGPARRR